MIESGRGRLALALLLCLAMLGADAPPAAQERPGEGRRGEEKKPDTGPNLEDLRRQIEQGSRESSGSPTLPSGSGSSGSVIDTLRGRPRPEPAPAAPSTPSFGDSGSGSLGASGAPASPKPFFLDVQAPAQVVYNGAPPAPCVPAAPPSATGRAAAPAPTVTPQTNQAAICVTGSAFEASAQIQIRPAPSPYLTQVMNTPGNPGQAIYLFTAPGPGKYRFMFEARLGSDSQTRDVEIEVREAGDASARINLDVRAPAEIVFNGPPPPQLCAGGPRPGRNQAVICVTGTSFDRTFQVVVEAAQVPGLVEASNNGRGQAVYVFTAPGPGTYKLVFRARLGNDAQTKDVELRVVTADTASGSAGSGGVGGTSGGPGGGTTGAANERPTIEIVRVDLLRLRVEVSDPDRADRLCIRPGTPGDLVNAREACGTGGYVAAEYQVSDARVRRDPPTRAVRPACKRFSVVFTATDGKSTVSKSQEISIDGCWLFTAVGGSSGLTLVKVLECGGACR